MTHIPDADPDEPVETKPFKFVTAGFDARFPNQNQTKHCWQNYVDYHKCIIAKGEDFRPCRQNSSTSPTDLSAPSPGLIDGMANAKPVTSPPDSIGKWLPRVMLYNVNVARNILFKLRGVFLRPDKKGEGRDESHGSSPLLK
uniref:Putative cytochrome c oxidase subunit VIb n=1 Tax=Paracoccidioides brasiliensis TaxID=121759 RepID=Q53AN6_PARBR|nr:putative cytochrome c oxidase subunit VIb [Paracoccidioides brasiliensis]